MFWEFPPIFGGWIELHHRNSIAHPMHTTMGMWESSSLYLPHGLSVQLRWKETLDVGILWNTPVRSVRWKDFELTMLKIPQVNWGVLRNKSNYGLK